MLAAIILWLGAVCFLVGSTINLWLVFQAEQDKKAAKELPAILAAHPHLKIVQQPSKP